MWIHHIAGLSIRLHEPAGVLAELESIYQELGRREEAHAADPRNPHLCQAGCSHCCRSGAFFAVTLVEAVRWSMEIDALPGSAVAAARGGAERLLAMQGPAFALVEGPADEPGRRDEELFSARVSRAAMAHPACPILAGDLCSTYGGRPFLCRAYGFPVDAYAVHGGSTIAFRSLCHLYAGKELADYVRAGDLRARLGELSRALAGGRELGRFTSAEAILATLDRSGGAAQVS